MSRWKLGSMVRIKGLFHLLINGVYWSYHPLTNHLLTSTWTSKWTNRTHYFVLWVDDVFEERAWIWRGWRMGEPVTLTTVQFVRQVANFIFTLIWGRFPVWLTCFTGVETTHQVMFLFFPFSVTVDPDSIIGFITIQLPHGGKMFGHFFQTYPYTPRDWNTCLHLMA